MDANETMRKMLDGFDRDPPDSDFQEGFLEGLRLFAVEGLHMNLAVGAPSSKPRPFQVIDGGKTHKG